MSIAAQIWPARSPAGAVRAVAVVVLTIAVIGVAGAAIGEMFPLRLLLLLAAGALLAQAKPEWRVGIACSTGTVALATLNPVFSLYFMALVGALAVLRRRTLPFVVVLVAAAILYPKWAFTRHYHDPGYWNWINESNLTLVLFVGAMWLRLRGRSEGANPAPHDDPLSFFLYFLFPSHAANPMLLSPALLSRERRVEVRATLTLLAWFAAKAAALVALRRLGPGATLAALGPADVDTVGTGALWGRVLGSYLETFLILAASADIPILIGRLFGFPLPDPFRFPLLAWNPVQVWRRWGLYNRNALLQLVYFPLGGSQKRKYLNVMLTFLASALLLHTGWFGSKYWEVGVAGWRDQSIYFLLQGLSVCACLALWDRTGKDPRDRATPPLSVALVAAVLGTQAWNALVHVMILAPNVPIGDRVRLVARCLGLG